MNGKDGFWGWLLSDWNLFRPGTWLKILLLLTIFGWFKVSASALDGDNCGGGWNIFSPESSLRNVGCLTRSFFRNVPADWNRDPGGAPAPSSNSQQNPPNVVRPPQDANRN